MMIIGSSVDYVRSGGMRNVPVTKAVEHLYATTAKFSGCVNLASRPAYSYPPHRSSSSHPAVKMQLNTISDALSAVSPVSLAAALAALFLTVAYLALKSRGLPPGPVGLPYFGYWPFININDFHLKLDEMKKKYGDILSFTCTGRLYINLGSIKVTREALITKAECFGDRMSGYSFMGHIFKNGLIFLSGEPWKNVRKFFLVLLKERGTNSIKTSLAGPLYDSIKSTIGDLKAKKGEPVNLIELLTHKCNTILRLTLFGEVGATEEQIRKFNEMYAVQISALTLKNSLLNGTFAKYFIFPFMPKFSEALKCHNKMEKLLYGIINEHKTTYDAENPRDIIDEYFKERDKRRSRGDPTAEYFTDETLMSTLMQFMGDGVLSVSSFTCLLMKSLLMYPEEQEKLYKEVMEVVGPDRQPTIEDKSRLTYFNAYIQEAIRTADFFNFFPTQECIKETTLGGRRIPKGAVLLLNFYSSHHDPEVYEEPEKFNPSRFIQTGGKRKEDSPILFGLGKRSCLGEGYVLMQVFLIISTLIQNFQLSLPEGSTKISIEEFTTSNLLICAKPRDKN
ncbi:Cytochrome P450 2J3 [Araneus ventricosus]|uniref:Cytochrome P450 2J3 n=1 Tax=Araneus ventricosus TaxID=182803 RepID=A0A4Y2IHH2_ARAVE|nr:Cytochrome P450 2J3 [Araneus ventricosus]